MTETLGKFAIYLPAYNAAITLPRVLDRIPERIRNLSSQIIVVDNHSSDETERVALDYREKHGLEKLKVIRNPKNLGYGGSQKVAYRYCLENGFDSVVMLHADGQYAPEVIETVLTPVIEKRADLVFGSRIRGNPLKGGMPIHRFLGNRVLTTCQNLVLGSRLSEFHSGYRVFSLDALRRLPFERLSDDYHFDTEVIILMLGGGFRVQEVPIPTFYGDEENYVNIWKYAVQVLVTTFTYFLHKQGIRRSRNWGRILGEFRGQLTKAQTTEK